MKRKPIIILLLLCFILSMNTATSYSETPNKTLTRVNAVVINGDTMPNYVLKPVYCYPKLKFKNKKQEKYYWRLVYDVKKTLPLSYYIRDLIKETNDTLMKLPNKRARDKYMKGFEKRIYKANYDRMSKMTLRQGMLLMRLVDRECDASSYDLIKAYRGSFRAGFYQLFAKMCGANLKQKFGENKDDVLIERIITLVEAGQL